MRQNRSSNTRLWRLFRPSLGALGLAVAAASAACAGGEEPAACEPTLEVFTREVYAKVLAPSCVGCHAPGGVAHDQGAKFLLQRDSFPEFAAANVATMRDYARLEIDGKPLLLRKPLGEEKHGGGAVLRADSAEYKLLAKFVDSLGTGGDVTCPKSASDIAVELLPNDELFRKAALNLAGRLPTDAEYAGITTESGLDAALLTLTFEENFYQRFTDIWNDVLLTERGFDVSAMRQGYPAADVYSNDQNPGYTPANRNLANIALRREPLQFIDYILRNKRPFTEIVSSDYVVTNPYLGTIYGVGSSVPATEDTFWTWEKHAGPTQAATNGQQTVPLAGVLSTPAFLSRWETTPTNRSRKRARIVQKVFLATDIFKFAQRPVDPSALQSVQNAPLNDGECRVCHTVNDPIAGAFRGYRESGSAPTFDASDKWHDDMAPPGFGTERMPGTSYPNALHWLGEKIANDPRFPLSVTHVLFRGIVGDEPLTYPAAGSANFDDEVQAFDAQNAWMTEVGKDFAANGFDVRRIVVAIVKSPYFRSKGAAHDRPGRTTSLGGGRLLPPEVLSNKYRAVLGVPAGDRRGGGYQAHFGYEYSWLREDWRLLYGGIDSKEVLTRVDTLSPSMYGAATYFANRMACRATAYDFTKAPAERLLFAGVEPTTVPFAPRTDAALPQVPVAESEAKVRKTLVNLYWRLLGERQTENSEEINRAYTLFANVWKGLEASSIAKAKTGGDLDFSDYECRGIFDWSGVKPSTDGNIYGYSFPAIPDNRKIERDPNFTIRSWQAVMTYLLSDYRFLHE